jgi:hypothetical protein
MSWAIFRPGQSRCVYALFLHQEVGRVFEGGVLQLPSHVQWEGYLRARLGKETATLSSASVSSVEKDYLLSIQFRE